MGRALCPWVRHFTHITPLDSGENEYQATGSEEYCQNASTDVPNRQLVLYASQGVEKEIGLSWLAVEVICNCEAPRAWCRRWICAI